MHKSDLNKKIIDCPQSDTITSFFIKFYLDFDLIFPYLSIFTKNNNNITQHYNKSNPNKTSNKAELKSSPSKYSNID